MRETQPPIRETQPSAIGASRVAGWNLDPAWVRFTLLATVPGIVCALIGPFGSYAVPMWMRLAFWVPTMMLGALAGALVTRVLDRWPALERHLPLRLLIMSTAVTGAMTAVVMIFSRIVFGSFAAEFSLTLVFYVWLITIVMTAIANLAFERNKRVAAAATRPQPPGETPLPALDARLPAPLRGRTILALQAEDHYVRVHTDAGSDLILMRLSDASREMGGIPGARTHRSWWVRKDAVKSASRREGKMTLILTNALEVPVSRGYASELKEAGWTTG